METIFSADYIKTILQPFEGCNIRMIRENENKTFSIPFLLETSVEAPFRFKFLAGGIKLLLADNFYIKNDIRVIFNEALKSVDIYPYSLDKLLDVNLLNGKKDCVAVNLIMDYFDKNFAPQIGFMYYGFIKSIKVEDKEFVINGIKFIVVK